MLDAVVIGANIRGLVTAYVLDRLGCSAAVLERSSELGGADGSFRTAGGTWFDYGLHVVDFMRSELVTKLFTLATGGRVHRTTLRRGIVLRKHILPYAAERAALPDEIGRLLAPEPLIDDIGGGPPDRSALARAYGSAFTDVIFGEVLPSFRSEHRHVRFGVDPSRLLTNIYPWFFPRAKRRAVAGDPSRAFHDRLREGLPQDVLYPAAGRFAAFAEGFARNLDSSRVELVLGAGDLDIDVRPGTHTIESITAGGRRFVARRYFWAGPWPPLCRLLDLPCQDAATDRVHLGSFRFDRPVEARYHELLVGDPALTIDRVHFPGAFRRTEDPLVQIEFAVPLHDGAWPVDADAWRSAWLRDLVRLGIIGEDHRAVEFDHRSFRMHFNSFGAEGEPLRDADPSLLSPDSNVHPVAPSMANVNLNRYVPEVVASTVSILSRGP
jgi:hypothetical protein